MSSNAERRATPAPALSALGVEKRFAGVIALDGVDIEVGQGETLGLLGPNGSGKTTLVNCVSGVVRPNAGRILVDGIEIGHLSRDRRARAGLVRTYQNLRLFADLTVAENVEVGLLARGARPAEQRRTLILRSLAEQGLEDVARLPVSELPYGAQKRVEVARALVAEPKVLLLDEPGAGLGDSETDLLSQALRSARSRLSCAILMIDHNVNLIMGLSDRIVVLSDGKVLRSGTPDEIASDPEVISVYLGQVHQKPLR